jgi:predicted dehydrogenase
MNASDVKVGLVGLGLVSKSHITAYMAHPNATIVAVCDLDEARAKAVATAFGIPKCYTSYDRMLADPEINTVDIATPTVRHAPMSMAAARAGKNIHCEKPFCMALAEGQAVCREAEKRGVTLMVGESYVFMTSLMKARQLIDAGEIGKPQQIRERFGAWVARAGAFDTPGRPITGDHRGWRADSTRAGGAGFPWMYDHGVHFFATARYLMNDSRIREVYAPTSDLSWMNDARRHAIDHSEASADIPIMTWTYEDPACQGLWMRADAHNGKYDPMYGFSASIIGDKGMIEVLGEGGRGLQWRGQDVHLVLHRKNKETLTFRFDEGGDEIWQSDVSYYGRAHLNQIRAFVDALVHGHAPRYAGLDGLRDVQTTMAAICSAKEGVAVKVDDVSDERLNR